MRVLVFFWVVQAYAAFNLTWGTPALNLDSNPPIGDTDENAKIAMDSNGNTIASWSRTAGAGAIQDVWAALYNHSLRTWTGAVKISGGGNAANSRVAIDAKGNAIVVWDEGFPSQIMFRTLTKEGLWIPDLSHPATLVCESDHAEREAQIAMDSSGNAIAIWMEFPQGISRVYSAKKLASSSEWVSLGLLSSEERSAALFPTKAIAMNDSGYAIAVWQEAGEIHGAEYVQGHWMPSMPISINPGRKASSPSVGVDEVNNGVIVWEQEERVLSRALSNGQPSGNILYASGSDSKACNPNLGVDAKGNALVVFERSDGLHKFITSASLPFRARAWTTAADISPPRASASFATSSPILSLNAIGDGVAIWKESFDGKTVIQGAGFALGTWSFTKTLSSLEGNSGTSTYDADVFVNLTGNIMAVWPEDPKGTETFQIKATTGIGLANAGPLPPKILEETIEKGVAFGKQVLHRFPAHADLINILHWTASENVAYYKIYRGNLSTLIGTSTKPSFEDHQRISKKAETYLITAVDSHEQESSPMTLVVHPR